MQLQVFPGFEVALIAILMILLVLLLLALQQKRVVNKELKRKAEFINDPSLRPIGCRQKCIFQY